MGMRKQDVDETMRCYKSNPSESIRNPHGKWQKGKLASDMPEAQNPRDTSVRSEPKVCSERAELGRGLNRPHACDRATRTTGNDISLDTGKGWQGASYAESMAMGARWATK
jgi:hypothetical protein